MKIGWKVEVDKIMNNLKEGTSKASGSLVRVSEMCLAIPGSLHSNFLSKFLNQTSGLSLVHLYP